MTDFWIVSDHEYRKHFSLKRAECEMARLIEKHPDKAFRVYRIKDSLVKSKSRQTIHELTMEIARLKKQLKPPKLKPTTLRLSKSVDNIIKH